MGLTLFVVSFLVFALNEYAPGDVASKLLGPYATADQVDKLNKELGLDRPILVRYTEYMGRALTGDLGESLVYRQPVSTVLWDRLRNTLLLAAISFAVIVPFSVLLGVLAGMRERSRTDRAVSVFSSICASIPEFAMGVFLLAIFVVWLGVLPGTSPLRADSGWPLWTQFVLPVAVVTLYDAGYLISMVRASMVEVMRQPYIRTAILKGMPFPRVVMRHAMRNAIITPFTVILLQLNYLVSGLVVVEMLFAYPGFGRLMLEAALAKDIAVIEAGALVAVFVTMLTQLLGDIGYMALDPEDQGMNDQPPAKRKTLAIDTAAGPQSHCRKRPFARNAHGPRHPDRPPRRPHRLDLGDLGNTRALATDPPAEQDRPVTPCRPVPLSIQLARRRPSRPRYSLAPRLGRAHRFDGRPRGRLCAPPPSAPSWGSSRATAAAGSTP